VIDDARSHQHRRRRRACVALGAVVLAAVCAYVVFGGGGGGARSPVPFQGAVTGGLPSSPAGGAPSSSSLVPGASVKEISATGGSYSGAQLLKFAQCARANGDPNFPDPTSQGAFVGIVPGSSEIMSAQQNCDKDLPHATPSLAQQQLFVKKAVVYAQCMLSHGVLDFPDPTSGGDLELNWRPGTDLDPSSPIFLRATRTCTKPHGALPGGL
jgi:hypothetical protein